LGQENKLLLGGGASHISDATSFWLGEVMGNYHEIRGLGSRWSIEYWHS
jgi:hypothetical protein